MPPHGRGAEEWRGRTPGARHPWRYLFLSTWQQVRHPPSEASDHSWTAANSPTIARRWCPPN